MDGERNPIGRRTESDRTADGIRSGGGRNPPGGAAVSAAPTKQAERVFPQNTQNTQNLLAKMGLPQIAQIFRLGGYGIPAIPTQPIAHHNFCGFREFRGRFFSASNSVRSVDSVGKPTQPNHLCRSVKSVGEHEYSHRIRRIQNNSKANNTTIYDFEIRRNRHRRRTRRMRGGSCRSTHGRDP